jgi:hypothetical protein
LHHAPHGNCGLKLGCNESLAQWKRDGPITCDETRTFSNLVDQDELHLQNVVSSMSNLQTINNHAIATQTLHCSGMLNKDLTCDETRTFSNLVDQDELRLILHHRSFHTYETSAQRLFH